MPEQYEPIRYELSVEEDVPPGVKKSEHAALLFEQIQLLLKKQFIEAGVIE